MSFHEFTKMFVNVGVRYLLIFICVINCTFGDSSYILTTPSKNHTQFGGNANDFKIDFLKNCGRREACVNQSFSREPNLKYRFEDMNYQLHPYECRCDEDGSCVEFGDCCRSVVTKLSNNYQWKCAKVQSNKVWAMMISACTLRNTDKELEALCTLEKVSLNTYNFTLDVPVYSVAGKLYRNIYCAICNEVSLEDISPLNLRILCNNNTNGANMPEFEMEAIYYPKKRYWKYEDTCCGIFAEQLNGPHLKNKIPQIRFCFPSVDSCPADSDPNISRMCSSYTQSIYTRSKLTYKNPHCALCNGVNIKHNTKCISPSVSSRVQPDIIYGYYNEVLDRDFTCELMNLLVNNVTKYVDIYKNALLNCAEKQTFSNLAQTSTAAAAARSDSRRNSLNLIGLFSILLLWSFGCQRSDNIVSFTVSDN